VPITKDLTFCIDFVRHSYSDPVTGLALRAEAGVYKRWHAKKAGWLEKSHVKLDRIMVPDTPGPDPTAYAKIAEYMQAIGEKLHAVVPKKDRGVGKRLIMVTFELPISAASGDNWLKLSVSPDTGGLDLQKIWDALASLHRPDVIRYSMVEMIFGVWESNCR